MHLLTVSRLDSREAYYKRIDLVIEAVKQLEFCTLTIVGDGDDKIRLQQLAGACARIDFRGSVDEAVKHQLYEACDVFVLLSTKEGFGLVFLEAMQHGKPCIGSRQGATPEVLGKLGLFADSVSELVELLTAGHAMPGTLASIGCAGRERASTYFSYDHFKFYVKELIG